MRSSLLTLLLASSAAVAQTTAPVGLDGLSDDRLYAELAARGQDALLERALEQGRVPEARRDAIRAIGQLKRLARDVTKLRPAERQQAVARVLAGIREVIPRTDDPAALASYADALLTAGVLPDVNTLEYWGPSVTTQATLRPVVEVVIAMLDRAARLAGERASAIAEAPGASPNDAPTMRQIERLEALADAAKQNRALCDYYLALSVDPTDPRRAEATSRAIDFLAAYDRPTNPQRGNLKLALGKLHALRGDFDAARAALDEVAALDIPEGLNFAEANARRALIFQGKYFRAVVEVQAKDAAAAKKRYDDLLAWERSEKFAEPSVQTANELLEYRILALANDAASRERGNALLTRLLDARPELQGLILAQLRASIEPSQAAESLDAIQLRALMAAGQEQAARREENPTFRPDAPTLERALSAARELVARKSKPNVDARLVATARFLTGAFLELLDRRAEAAAAFLDFVEAEREPEQLPLARAALANAQRLFAQLGGLGSEDASVAALYDRILPISIASPFDQKELNYDWATRLQQQGKLAEAIKFYRAVPTDDRRYAASRYGLLVTLAQRLDAVPAAERSAMAAEVQSLADEVRADAARAIERTTDDGERAALRQRCARATVVAADVARRVQDDAARAVALLDGLDESSLAGVPGAAELLGEAMFIRVQADMRRGKTDEAVAGLVKLLEKSGGSQGAQIVFNLLGQLERDVDRAEAAGDRARVGELQAARASLTPYLVSWAEKSERPEVRASAYRYRVYDAETQRIAAEFIADPAQRDARRAEALKRFEALDAPDGRAQYEQSRGDAGGRNLGYDPQVALGLARLKFDAGDFGGARDAYARLLADRAVGSAVAVVTGADGRERTVDNEAYWESMLRFARATLENGGDAAPIAQMLREQRVRWGDRAGGTRWRADFVALSRELGVEVPSTAPATRAE